MGHGAARTAIWLAPGRRRRSLRASAAYGSGARPALYCTDSMICHMAGSAPRHTGVVTKRPHCHRADHACGVPHVEVGWLRPWACRRCKVIRQHHPEWGGIERATFVCMVGCIACRWSGDGKCRVPNVRRAPFRVQCAHPERER